MFDVKDVKIIRGRRKSISLHVLPDGGVEVKAPILMPMPFIRSFIEKHSSWIDKRIEMAKKTARPRRKYIQGEIFYFLGKEHVLTIGNHTKIEAKDGKLYFPAALSFRIKKELENWFVKQAKEIITAQTATYAARMETEFASIKLSDTKSKWGSCTADNRLQFNWRLVMAPLLVMRYVVIHELAHTKEKNHSHKFWSRVAAQNPSYKQQRKWLKTYGNTLWV